MPVVATCPQHGPFASRSIEIVDGRNAYVAGSEPCPICGSDSPIAEGRYDFDADGIASLISAPEWSQRALRAVQGELLDAARALADESNYSADRAYGLLEKKLDRLVEQNAATQGEVVSLASEVRSLKEKLTRSRLATVLFGITAAIGMIADGGAVANMTGDTVRWLIEQVSSGNVAP